MKIMMSGSTGLVGTAARAELEHAGHTVDGVKTPRPGERADDADTWRKAVAKWQPSTFEGADALICLGGEPIYGLWTQAKKKRIINSRYFPAQAMAEAAAGMSVKPRVIIAASASGFYGDTGQVAVTEDSPRGNGYLAETTEHWESAWDSARDSGIRVVTLRLGVVLSAKGGALKLMLPFFKLGLGGWLGRGDQWMGWVSLEDVARLITWAVENDHVEGAVNATAPNPVTNHDFSRALGKALNRPVIFRVPAFVVRTLTGNAADETVLASTRVLPAKAEANGFQFFRPTIEQALDELK